jgi:hypothetical protein
LDLHPLCSAVLLGVLPNESEPSLSHSYTSFLQGQRCGSAATARAQLWGGEEVGREEAAAAVLGPPLPAASVFRPRRAVHLHRRGMRGCHVLAAATSRRPRAGPPPPSSRRPRAGPPPPLRARPRVFIAAAALRHPCAVAAGEWRWGSVEGERVQPPGEKEGGGGGGEAARANSARVFTVGQRFYIAAVKKYKRPRFVGTHDRTAGKFGFTWWPVGVAPYIRLRW